jgi:exodeoxyribonuclease-3
MKIATYNVNGVNGRLPVLLRWLQEAAPAVVCLQELKAPQDKFPERPIRDAGYGAIWHGIEVQAEELERGRHSRPRARPR